MKNKKLPRSPIRIAIIEDDPLRIVGLCSILDLISDFEVASMPIAEVISDLTIQVAVVGNNCGPRFVDILGRVRSARPDIRTVVTGAVAGEDVIFRALACGAKGYVQDTAPPSELVRAIFAVHQGSIWAPRHVIGAFIDRSVALLETQPRRWALTPRERQVLGMLVEGRSNKEIGGPLGIEERTVKAHVAKLMRKAGVRNRIALSVHALSHALVSEA